MIFEMRTYLLKPGTAPKVEEMFGEMIERRAKLSRIAGFWRTEVGTLNQIIHIWPYQSVDERDRIRAEAVKQGVWPPKTSEFILDMESKILHPAPFSPAFEPGEHGGLYEFRTYTYGPGAIPKVIEAWSPRIKERTVNQVAEVETPRAAEGAAEGAEQSAAAEGTKEKLKGRGKRQKKKELKAAAGA